MAVRTAAAQALDTTISTLKTQINTYLALGTGHPENILLDHIMVQLCETNLRQAAITRASGAWCGEVKNHAGATTIVDADPLA
jgi:hypothetical protein